jgi:hypothetical protein
VAPGHDCGDTSSSKFKGNVAHSVQGSGAYIYPDPAVAEHGACYEGSHFAAYKVTESGLATHYRSEEIRMRDMTFIDNQEGISLQTAGDRDVQQIRASNMVIYGESEAEDCPSG